VIGIKCDPTPNSLFEIYKQSPFYDALYDESLHDQNNDFYLNKNHINYTSIYAFLKIGCTCQIKYKPILCKNYDDQYNYNDLYGLYKYKLRMLNHVNRVYFNYIDEIKMDKIYKKKITVYDIKKSPFDDYYIIEDDLQLFLSKYLLIKNNKYKIYYKKSHYGKNYYFIIDVI